MKEPKYVTIFSSEVRPVVSEEKDRYLALASLLDLEKFVPKIDTEKDVDLLPIAFNAFVANRVNKNGDVINTDTALSMYNNFKNKPINVEHNRDRIIGTILTAGFSEFGTDIPMTKEEASKTSGPFNVTLGGVVWRVVNPGMADYIEESADPTSENYMKVSASWELGFTDYNIVELSGEEKNIENGNIITDELIVKGLEEKLKAFGGDGTLENGNKIYRQVINNVVPLGIGLTESPAAEVSGIATEASGNEEEELSDLREKIAMSIEKLPTIKEGQIEIEEMAANENIENGQEKQENFSQSREKDVSQTNRGSNMKVTSIKQITDESLKELSASAVSDFIEQELKTASEHYYEEKTRMEDSLKASQDAQEKLEETNKVTQEELDKVKASLEGLQKEQTERAAQDAFNERMAAMDETYELTDEDRQVIASQVKNLDDEAFAKYRENMKVLLSSKDKDSLKEKAEAEEADKATEETKASDENENVVEQALDKAEQIKEEIPVSATASDPDISVYDKYKKAFEVDNWSLGKR
jgi:hypothetical protein